jgi:hypothetical protein
MVIRWDCFRRNGRTPMKYDILVACLATHSIQRVIVGIIMKIISGQFCQEDTSLIKDTKPQSGSVGWVLFRVVICMHCFDHWNNLALVHVFTKQTTYLHTKGQITSMRSMHSHCRVRDIVHPLGAHALAEDCWMGHPTPSARVRLPRTAGWDITWQRWWGIEWWRSCKSRTQVGQPVTFNKPLSEPRRQQIAPALHPYSMPCIPVYIIVKGKTPIGVSPVVRPCSFIDE